MEGSERTVRLDLTASELLAISWAIWFSMPAAPQDHGAALDSASAKVMVKRRQTMRPGTTAEQPAVQQPAQLGDV